MGKRGSCGSRSEVPRPTSPANLEMQIPGPVSDQLNETLEVVGVRAVFCVNLLSRGV